MAGILLRHRHGPPVASRASGRRSSAAVPRGCQSPLAPSAGQSAQSAQIVVTAPSGARAPFFPAERENLSCMVTVDDRQGSYWYQIQYLSPSGDVVSNSPPALIGVPGPVGRLSLLLFSDRCLPQVPPTIHPSKPGNWIGRWWEESHGPRARNGFRRLFGRGC